jgi:hypothetical protein
MLAGDSAPYAAIWCEGDDISHLGPTGALCTGPTAVFEQFARQSAWVSRAPWWLTLA